MFWLQLNKFSKKTTLIYLFILFTSYGFSGDWVYNKKANRYQSFQKIFCKESNKEYLVQLEMLISKKNTGINICIKNPDHFDCLDLKKLASDDSVMIGKNNLIIRSKNLKTNYSCDYYASFFQDDDGENWCWVGTIQKNEKTEKSIFNIIKKIKEGVVDWSIEMKCINKSILLKPDYSGLVDLLKNESLLKK